MYRFRAGSCLVAMVSVALLAMGACGKSKTQPGAPSAPVASSTPRPAAPPTPEPPLSASCARLPAGSAKYACDDRDPDFRGDVLDAIFTLRGEHPEIFDAETDNLVLNVGAYYVGLIRALDRKGICAGFDGEELAVKTSNDFNEQYKVLTSRNLVNSKYIGTCSPAAFPLPQGALPPSPSGCPLPPSQSVACGTPPTRFEDSMQATIGQVLNDKPELFDYSDRSPVTGFPRVVNFDGYYSAVIAQLSKQGFCARFDGEEMVIKKTNEFSEHYKINLSDRWVRMGAGIYRSACYPAAF